MLSAFLILVFLTSKGVEYNLTEQKNFCDFGQLRNTLWANFTGEKWSWRRDTWQEKCYVLELEISNLSKSKQGSQIITMRQKHDWWAKTSKNIKDTLI